MGQAEVTKIICLNFLKLNSWLLDQIKSRLSYLETEFDVPICKIRSKKNCAKIRMYITMQSSSTLECFHSYIANDPQKLTAANILIFYSKSEFYCCLFSLVTFGIPIEIRETVEVGLQFILF